MTHPMYVTMSYSSRKPKGYVVKPRGFIMRTSIIASLAVVAALVAHAADEPPFDAALGARLPTLRRVIPAITTSAEAAVVRLEANPYASLQIPRNECAGLNEELISRAGGLTHVGSRRRTPDDVQLFAVRDWETFGPRAAWLVDQWRAEGNLVVVFGSAAGRPDDLHADFFIDNGAPDGSSAHASVNAAANVALAWMWCCEYAAAFSREGKFPAITKGIVSESSKTHNDGTIAPDRGLRLYRCDTPVAAGDLAITYLNRVAKLLADIREPPVSRAIVRSAELVADRLAAGRRVAVAGLGHMILEEPKHGLKSPMIGFRAVSMLPHSFPFTVEKGDLLVWITYSGMNSAWDDYSYAIARSEADVIASFADTPAPSPKDGLLEFIPQPWTSPDAEVAIPVPPYAMAPVSAIARILVLRLLDEEVAALLAARGISVPRPEIARPDAFHDFGQRQLSPLSAARSVRDPGDRWGALDSNGCVVAAAEYPDPPWISRNYRAHFRLPGTNVVVRLDTGAVSNSPARPRPAPAHGFSGQRVAGKGGFRLACTNGLWGGIDKLGAFVVEPRYDNLRWAGDHLLVSQVGEKYGLVATDGREIQPPVFDVLSPNGDFIAAGSNLLYGILAPDGSRFLTALRHGSLPTPAGGGRVKWRVGGKTGLYTLEGREILAPVHDAIGMVAPDYAIVRDGTRWSLAPLGTNAPSIAGDYARIEVDPSGGFRVEEGRLFGLLAKDGTPVAPIAYEPVSLERDAVRGERIVRRDGALLLLSDNGGTRPFPYPCDHADYFFANVSRRPEAGSPPKPALYRVAKDGRWGVVDGAGNILLPLDYSYVGPCHVGPFDAAGRAYVATGGVWRLDADIWPTLHGAKWGACDATGAIRVPPLYDGLESRNGGWIYVQRQRHTTMTP